MALTATVKWMAVTWYFLVAVLINPTNANFVSDDTSDVKIYFLFETVSNRSRSGEERAEDWRDGSIRKTLDLYYDGFASSDELLNRARVYDVVIGGFTTLFRKLSSPEESIEDAISGSLDFFHIQASLTDTYNLLEKSGFWSCAEFGFLSKAVFCLPKLLQHEILWKTSDNAILERSILAFVSGKTACNWSLQTQTLLKSTITTCPNPGQKNIGKVIDALETHFFELSVTVTKSNSKFYEASRFGLPRKNWRYFKKPGFFTGCHQSKHRRTTRSFCRKLRKPVCRCL